MGNASWHAHRLVNHVPGDSPKIGVASLERIVVSSRGTCFEDCWRRVVMLDEDDLRDKLRHLLFDFRDNRYSSKNLGDFYRDKILGLRPSAYAAGRQR